MEYKCEDCGKTTRTPLMRRRKNPLRDAYICASCDEKVANSLIKEKERVAREEILTDRKMRSEKKEKTRAKRKKALEVLNDVRSTGGSGISHDSKLNHAMTVLRSAWNSDRTIFFVISGGGGMVRYYDANSKSLPKFAKKQR